MSNKIKCLLLNLTLLAGVYCSWGCSCCADCYKKCCWNGGNKKTDTQVNQDSSDSYNDKNEKGPEDTKDNEEQQDLYFKIEGGAIDNNNLKCFGEGWFEEYQKKKADNNNNAILLYKLTEQKNKQEKEAGTLVYSQKSKELQYRNGGDLPASLKDSDNKWAIFKVTTLKKGNNEEQEGDSHIFYCSNVSSIQIDGLFKGVRCYSIKILAANTKEVENFSAMFYRTKSYLERDAKQPGASGFIGLEKLDLSSALVISYMFYRALFKQETINSLQT